ncbi:hypothetical protein [Paenibacillus borealis]|uniref:Lipoprotein n=1 Tax=Paenibacillus borealis TaxID=160799 RepID=A0A089LJS0_PAEBO|nr:hypothetical protein [Paenibacillus borealis]AIQ60355.1 hypothetical protein PBOR_27955 [Paenibacillus borealis]
MNAKLSKFASLFFLSLLLAACSADKQMPAGASAQAEFSVAAASPGPAQTPVPAVTGQPLVVPVPSPSPGQPEQPASSPLIAAAPSPGSEEAHPLQKYMDAVHGDMRGDLLFSAKQDLDLDGYEEIVLGYGDLDQADPQYSRVSELHVLRDRDGKIEELTHDFEGGYQKLGFKLIRLQGLRQTFIYCDLTNDAGMTGFMVLEISGDQVLRKVYSAAATGQGEDALLDNNGDGQYDGYVQYRADYSTFYYSLDRTYEMESGEIVLKETKVGIPEYPQEIKDVILQYLSLSALQVEQSPETEERLALLRIDKDGTEITGEDLSGWREALEGYHSEIQFDIKQDGLASEAFLTYTEDDNKPQTQEHTMQLHLVKAAAGWQIDGLEIP